METLIQPLIDKTEFTLEELKSDRRIPRLVIVRHLLFLFLRNQKDKDKNYLYTYKQIGAFLNRDHSTALYGIKQAEMYIEAEDTLVMIYVNKLGLEVHRNILRLPIFEGYE